VNHTLNYKQRFLIIDVAYSFDKAKKLQSQFQNLAFFLFS